MKRLFVLLLIAALCSPLLGCAKETVRIQDPVSFYYQREALTYGEENSVILSESRESAGHRHSPGYLLKEYLTGPVSDNLAQTFPPGTTLVQLTINNSKATILLSSHIANLTGMDLTIACACLTLTVMELTGAETVEIQAKNALLDDAESIVMDRDCLLLLDNSATKPAD